MRTAMQTGAKALPDPKRLDRMLSAAPAQLLSKLPALPTSALEFSEKLYHAALPKPSTHLDRDMSRYERVAERVQNHFIATPLEAEALMDVYAMARVVTGSMARRYIEWCHQLAEFSVSTDIVRAPSRIRMSMVICAPLYMQVERGLEALQSFVGLPIAHQSWTDFDAEGNAIDVRKAIYWQLVLLLVPMPPRLREFDILEAIVEAYDIAGNFDARGELKATYGRARYGIHDVVKRLQRAHVALVVIYGWRDIHRQSGALWRVLYALREARIAVVLVATAAIALCRDDPQFLAVFPADPIEIGPYQLDHAANLARAYAATLELGDVPPAFVGAVRGVYGQRQLMDALAERIARQVHLEGMASEVAARSAIKSVAAEYKRVLEPYELLLRGESLSAELIARHRDRLPLVVVQEEATS